MTRPATYVVQDGCHNCANAYVPRRVTVLRNQTVVDGYYCLHGFEYKQGETLEQAFVRARENVVEESGKCGEWVGEPDIATEAE
jgi:NADH pyrophosphatase NudC (nudix superfamily)